MVDFIKPGFLGTERQFGIEYAGPIRNGQHADSNIDEIRTMKKKSFILHKKLYEFVQRKEASLLKTFLPEKYEYVLFLPLTEIQNKLYKDYLKNEGKLIHGKGGVGSKLLQDYTCLRKIWTHPKVLERAYQNSLFYAKRNKKQELKGSVGDWWRNKISNEELNSVSSSHKIIALFEILRLCNEAGDKCLLFSSFVAVLNMVEDFMRLINAKDPMMMKFICKYLYFLLQILVILKNFSQLKGKT